MQCKPMLLRVKNHALKNYKPQPSRQTHPRIPGVVSINSILCVQRVKGQNMNILTDDKQASDIILHNFLT